MLLHAFDERLFLRALNLAAVDQVVRKERALRHEHLHHVEEGRMAVQLEGHLVQNEAFLRYKFVAASVEPQVRVWLLSAKGLHSGSGDRLVCVIFSGSRLVAGKLPQELARARYHRVFL